jgi:hypothetical protein
MDRWTDGWNVMGEMVVLNQGRGLGALAFLAAQTGLKSQPWRSVAGQINVPSSVRVGAQTKLTMSAPGIDLSSARITWEPSTQQPSFGQSLTFTPNSTGAMTVQVEAQMPDGRRIFAKTSINVTN